LQASVTVKLDETKQRPKPNSVYLRPIRSFCVGVTIFESFAIIVLILFHIGHPMQQLANFITVFFLLLINRSLEFEQKGFSKGMLSYAIHINIGQLFSMTFGTP